jgi:hypothetical protein
MFEFARQSLGNIVKKNFKIGAIFISGLKYDAKLSLTSAECRYVRSTHRAASFEPSGLKLFQKISNLKPRVLLIQFFKY